MTSLHPGAPAAPLPAGDRPLVSRLAVEIAVAAVLFGLGLTTVVGSLEFNIGWDDNGPQPGYFPFYVGLIVTAGALGAGIQAWLRRGELGTFLTHEQGRRIGLFYAPVIVFVLLCSLLGIYVAMAIYLVFTTRVQGGYGWAKSLAIGIGTAVAFFVMFELLFGQPLLKGPLESWLGFS